ncbi:423_t:CDS:10, partial [Paraglomus occultum]
MESYPGEFVFHHYPLMAVMGLGAHKDIENSISPPSSPNQPKSPASRRSSTSAPTHSISTRLQLSRTLLNILLAKGQDTVWEPPKHGNLMFRVVALEKNHQFPVKKTGNKAVSSHSSLSPMTPDSPLYPDGLITPIWVKKHREVAPSVVVGFYDLWEWSMGGVSIDEKEKLPHVPEPLGNINPIEREKDTDLVAEINERKKTIIDRGIKFTVVILLRSQHVDDSNIDERLNYIKKMCSLEGKNMFFVLPPSSQNELQEFATNLQKSLYDHALAYYRELSKRIKKKRSRLPSTTSAPNVRREEKSDNTNQPLIVQGWMVRYDYKMAMFAEFRQEIDSAVKYYISAYDLLVDMFAPVPLITPNAPRLTPRTKRWAEAKVLADSMNLKICKLYLYFSGYTQSVSHLNKHVSTFHGLSDSFHMGKDTFEYWTWKTKQYRLYGDLLDIAVRNGFKIPSVETWTNTYESRGAGGSGYGVGSGSGAAPGGVDPRLILQHAGFYYHQAAMCNIERRKKFLAVETLSKESPDSPDLPPQASLTAERSVDHSALTIELLTKSYEQFKKYKSGRMTLYLASEIAGTYYDVNKYEMALRQAQATYGRWCSMSTKTYRKESWHTVLESILRWSLKCAKEIGSWDTAIEIMVELLSDRFTMSEEARLEIQNDLKSILSQPNNPSSTLRIDMDQINSFVTVHFQFKRLTTFVGTSTPFQLSLGTSHTSPPVPFQLSFIRLIFSDPYFNHYIRCGPITDSEKSKEKLQYLDIKNLKQEEIEETGVVWAKDVEYEIRKNSIVVFEGLVVPKESGDLTLMSVCLGTVTSSWKVELNFSINEQGEGIQRRKWMELGTENEVTRPKFINLEGSGDRPSIKVIQKQAKIDFKASHHPPALLNEMYPIELKITNNEPEEVRVIMNAEIMAADAQ